MIRIKTSENPDLTEFNTVIKKMYSFQANIHRSRLKVFSQITKIKESKSSEIPEAMKEQNKRSKAQLKKSKTTKTEGQRGKQVPRKQEKGKQCWSKKNPDMSAQSFFESYGGELMFQIHSIMETQSFLNPSNPALIGNMHEMSCPPSL
jgi:hypothetical protein